MSRHTRTVVVELPCVVRVVVDATGYVLEVLSTKPCGTGPVDVMERMDAAGTLDQLEPDGDE